ncbi:acetoacetate decarboxylase family protein [Paraburkholderia sp. SEWSISQ10-3 4]|uniref:acetoacetate decarboxylase family protein n=1 Tax=Paraburkholderia TaxID=1822464 RepID=UPI002254A6EC|nr:MULTISPECIES: acetoacetate decarboxylase family protein [Paraburkholderia]MCX4140683.1 acetoacetate decarboxylase family protein [Paraburkholderia aspalathi]MDN7173368.1 acetoacetate decarboxylase family protein [Paraburkholderia sp. SEWSISQ10-3 4]MDQ6503009.1 acetoacetate decarboxylase family protein [Paraburkholderia aspalathi]
MTVEFKPGVRYRMPAVFGPAPGPRQKADGTLWMPEESGVMKAQWMTVRYRTEAASIERILPPGFSLRGRPEVHVSLAFFSNLYWLAGRGYGILNVEVPVTYTGKTETIDGAFCPVLFEGLPDAILTGREELGFPKLFAEIPDLNVDLSAGTASGSASWFGFEFFEIDLYGLTEISGDKRLPGPGGATLFYKYMPRSGQFGSGGCDIAYATTSQPLPGAAGDTSPIKFSDANFRKWGGEGGSVKWNRATFEQLPTTFHVINGLADLEIIEYLGCEMIEFSAPGIAVSANVIRPVDPAV